jgi:hypothetical protein
MELYLIGDYPQAGSIPSRGEIVEETLLRKFTRTLRAANRALNRARPRAGATAGSGLPGLTPRDCASNPAGPSSSERRFQA